MPFTTDNAMVTALEIHKSFGALPVLKGVSLEVYPGEVIAIIGSSGSGKSTLLRCLIHLETITSGTIRIENDVMVRTDDDGNVRYKPDGEIKRMCSKMGMVFQQFNLFPHMTVLENVIEAPRTVKQLKTQDILPRAEELLKSVGLLEKRDAYPSHLSGGQQQRVAIARALAMDPDILLFDEPTSALDPELTGEVLKTIRNLAERRMTMVIVTHEMNFARDVANRAIFMDQGKIIESAPAKELFTHPQHPRTQAFLCQVL